jgi:hypothetical protein
LLVVGTLHIFPFEVGSELLTVERARVGAAVRTP